MKRWTALLGLAVLFGSMTVSAAVSPSAGAIYAEGFASGADYQAAEERGMSASEYYNNAVVSTPGV